jgi:hypothetical protein
MELEYRTTVSAGEGMDFVISDGSMDRHGTRINPNGWDLRTFLENPIALWSHGLDPIRGRLPIGRWENVRIVAGKLIGRLVIAASETSDFVKEIRSLVDQGILRAVSVGFEDPRPGKPGSGWEIASAGLREVSLVAVGSNPNALAMARSLNISESTIRMAFGEQAEPGLRGVSPGRNAVSPPATQRPRTMTTLAQRIIDAETEINTLRDKQVELTGADVLDVDAIEEVNGRVELAQRSLAALKASERSIGLDAQRDQLPAPAVSRAPLGFRQPQIDGLDLLVRKAVVRSCSLWSGQPIDQVLAERYPGQEAVAALVRADQTLGTTTVAGWVLELQQTSYAAFVDALRGKSIYPVLRDRGIGLSFDSAGTAYIPSLTAGGANGSFFAEGSPIRVGRITTAATTMTCRKMGVIIPFSREAAKRSTPNLESLVRQAIIDDTSATLDAALLDATAGDTVRPAGLLNGVSATATGFGGGDYQAVIEDFKALLAPFITANASDGITVVMNPTQGLNLALMPAPLGNAGWFGEIQKRVNIVESTHATAGRLIAVRNTDFATATGDTPDFEISNQATIHMEDVTPLEIVSGTGPTTADPVRSFFQTDSMGVRMVMDVSWKMRRSGMVSWINGTSW